jgi:hypothetical protein
VQILFPKLEADLQAVAPQSVVDAQATTGPQVCETAAPLRTVRQVGGVQGGLDSLESGAPIVNVQIETPVERALFPKALWAFELCVSHWGLFKTLLLFVALTFIFWFQYIKPFAAGAATQVVVVATGCCSWICQLGGCWTFICKLIEFTWYHPYFNRRRFRILVLRPLIAKFQIPFSHVNFKCGPHAAAIPGLKIRVESCVQIDSWFDAFLSHWESDKYRLGLALVLIVVWLLSYLYPKRSAKELSICETGAPVLFHEAEEDPVAIDGDMVLVCAGAIGCGKGDSSGKTVPDTPKCVTESQLNGLAINVVEHPFAPTDLCVLVVKDPMTDEISPNGMVECTKAAVDGETRTVGVFTGHQLEQMEAYGTFRLVHISAFIKGLFDPETLRSGRWMKFDKERAFIHTNWEVDIEHEGVMYSWKTRDHFFEGESSVDPYTGRDVALYAFPSWPQGTKPAPVGDWTEEVPIGPVTVYGCSKNDEGVFELRSATGCCDTDYRFNMPGPFPAGCKLIPEVHLGTLAHTVSTGGGCSGSPGYQYGVGSRSKKFFVHAYGANANNNTRNFGISGPTVCDLLRDYGFRAIPSVAKIDMSVPVTESPPARKRQRKAQWRAKRDGVKTQASLDKPKAEKGSADFSRNEEAKKAAVARGDPSYRKQQAFSSHQGPPRGQGDRPQPPRYAAGVANFRSSKGNWNDMNDDGDGYGMEDEDYLQPGSIGARERYEPDAPGRRSRRRQGNDSDTETSCLRLSVIPEVESELKVPSRRVCVSSLQSYSRKLMEVPMPQYTVPTTKDV